MKKPFSLIIYYFFTIFFMETVHKFLIYGTIWDSGLFYIALFSFLISVLFAFFSHLARSKTNKKIVIGITILLTLMFMGSFLYYTLFSVPFTFQVASMASQTLEFIGILFDAILKHIISLMIFCLPLCYFLWKKDKIVLPKIYFFEKVNLGILFVLTYVLAIICLLPFKTRDYSAYQLYWKQNNLHNSIRMLGLLTAERIDLQRAIFGFEEEIKLTNNQNKLQESMKYNKMEIDFASLIEKEKDVTAKSLYAYFENEIPTKQNAFTGMYQGKNLIFILAESFNSIAVSKELTPTLYKLTHTGFQFNRFYSPVFLSTTGGEFQAMTGLIPSVDTLNEWYKGNNDLPFALGNKLKNSGYQTYAYHDYEATFYNRTKTMPTLGFSNYYACLTGLEKEMECNWVNNNAPDDNEMIKVTFPKYAKNSPFMTYYITMSGHFPYELSTKTRNYEKVKNLPYSDTVKAYLSTQIDLDRALETLIKSLEKEGILDDTVICLVGDHYPYALSLNEINELSQTKRDEKFEANHSSFVIWNNEKDAVEVNKVGSQIDILPTLLNLFGLEYDSRLLIGHDILSDTEGLAIFSDMSWISDSGTYNASTKKFTKAKEVQSDYVSEMNKRVNNSSVVSKKIIASNIYRKILKNEV